MKGYNNVRTEYITEDAVCFKCGNCVRFVDGEGHHSIHMAPGDGGIALLAVHTINSLFAYTEHVVNPKIHVVHYPTFMKHAELTGL